MGIGFTWDSSRYLFYASQFADYGNTNTAPYALVCSITGNLQKWTICICSVFIVYSIMLSSIFVVLDFSEDIRNTIACVFVLIAVFYPVKQCLCCARHGTWICRNHLHHILWCISNFRIQKDFQTAGMSTTALQRFIGIASSNTILFVASLFVSGTMMEKIETYIKMHRCHTPLSFLL